MAYEAHVDQVSDRAIAGWVYDDAAPNDSMAVEILAGDEVIARVRADAYRPDLQAAGKGNGWHGFSFTLDKPLQGSALSARVAGKRWRIQPTTAATGSPSTVHQDPRRRYLHTLEFGHPLVETGFTEARPSRDEPALVSRLVEAFHRALRDDPSAGSRKSDIWSEIESGLHGEALGLLKRRDVGGLTEYLRNAHATDLTWGITQGVQMTAALRSGPPHTRSIATEYMDNLASLAEFLGILDVESSHQRGQWGENLHADPQALADAIAARVGFPIETPPAIGSYFGLRTRGGIVAGRDLCALYAALRLRDLAADFGLSAPRICEIGGGMGGVAYYAARMGMPYTVIDLPLVGLLQGYFLARALPDARLQLYGEPDSPKAAIRLLPTYCFAAQEAHYDLLLNQDSFPEMNAAYALGYLEQAATRVRHAFCSINQEARAPQAGAARQGVVRELVQQAAGGRFRRSSRHRHWLRAGYVEEVYRKTAGDS